MEATIACGILTDASSEMYQSLLEKGLINSGFGAEVFSGDGYFSVIFSGESTSPEEVRDALKAEIARIVSQGLSENDFQRIKKSTYGLLIRELNNVEAVANLMINAGMDKVSPFETIEILSEMKVSDCFEFIKNELTGDNVVMSVVEGE